MTLGLGRLPPERLKYASGLFNMIRNLGGAVGIAVCGAIPGSPEAGHLAALKALWHLAYREASTLAFADAFHAIMLAFIAATLLVPLLRQVTPAKAPAADAH